MIVLVTGATAGFGECITRRFIQQGHKVIATGRRQERLQELKDELGERRAKVLAMHGMGLRSHFCCSTT